MTRDFGSCKDSVITTEEKDKREDLDNNHVEQFAKLVIFVTGF